MKYQILTNDLSIHRGERHKLRKRLVKAVNEMLEARGGTVELNDDGDFDGVFLHVTYETENGDESTEVYYIHAAEAPDGSPSFILETEDAELLEWEVGFDDVCVAGSGCAT